MEKKNLAIILLAVVLAVSGVGNIILAVQVGIVEVVAPPKGQDLVFGTFQGDIVHLDPVYAYDTASSSIIDQVVETLYRFNLTDPDYNAIPWLASAMPAISVNGLEYTITLRTGVMFHDNTTMDATAVKWSFDRLAWFWNYSGNSDLPAPFNVSLPAALESGIPTPTQLWGAIYMNPDGTPIINQTVVVNANTIKFILNQPRAAWLSILAFTGSGILSPTSTPDDDYIKLTADLVGTGPFRYVSFKAGVEIKLAANEEYWGGRPQLDSVTVVVYSSLSSLNQALLSGDIDILTAMDPAFLDQHDADVNIVLNYAGGTLTTSWVTFNVDHISVGMRKAISYALNYSYIIDVVYDRVAVRLPTYIPMGIAYANYTLDYPTLDRTVARATLLADSIFGGLLTTAGIDANSPDADWITLAEGATPLAAYNYSWNIGNDLRHDTGDRLAADLKFIGVDLEVNGMAWGDLIGMIVNNRDEMDMYMLGWAPDYQDPENYLTAIWGNESAINGGNYNAPDVMTLMYEGVTETDLVKRKQIYDEVQRLMVERDYPGMTLTTGLNYDAWNNEIVGYPSNALGKTWWLPVYFD